MRNALLALSLAVLVVPLATADDEAAKKDLKALEGTWQLVSQTANGKEAEADSLKIITVTIDAAGKWKVLASGQTIFEGTVKLDPSKKPKASDWTVTEGDAKGKTALAIYEVDGDTFKHCFAAPDKDRPTKFESKDGSGITNAVYKRVKK